jgi:hypothetical protein
VIDPRVWTIRFWLVSALGLGLMAYAVADAESVTVLYAGMLIALVMPAFSTGCIECTDCCTADTMPCSAQITFEDVVDLNCTDCDTGFNATFTVSTLLANCVRQYGLTPIACGGSDAVQWEFRCVFANTEHRVTVELDHAGANNTFHRFVETLGAKPVACTGLGTRTPPFSSTSFSGSQQCDFSGATCTVIPSS